MTSEVNYLNTVSASPGPIGIIDQTNIVSEVTENPVFDGFVACEDSKNVVSANFDDAVVARNRFF